MPYQRWALALLLTLFGAGPAAACFTPPAQMVTPPDNLIYRSSAIYLVRAQAAEFIPKKEATHEKLRTSSESVASLEDILGTLDRPWPKNSLIGTVEYDFHVMETLHGPKKESISLTNKFLAGSNDNWTFDFHRDQYFWARGGGRSGIAGDCSIMLNFIMGEVYLIFVTEEAHVKAHERIGRADDLWLTYVRDALNRRPVE